MSLQAGIINVGGFLACHRFVTHITGFATHFGTESASGNWSAAFGMLTVPFFFVLGSMISGYFVDHRIAQGKEPRYLWVIGLIFFLLLSATLFGELGFFGKFGDPMVLEKDYSLLALLCLASGIQNAMITSASGSVVRTTHLTGVSTDLGIGIIRVLARPRTDLLRKQESLANLMRGGLILSFLIGSFLGAAIFYRFEYRGFALPVMITGGFLILALRENWQKRRRKS